MLKIGDFSVLSKISIRMLRHYNEIGLLIPAHIDDSSGYRYYSESQLTIANRITALRGMGISQAAIREILEQYNTSDSLTQFLRIQETQKIDEIEKLKQQLKQLQSTIRELQSNADISRCSISIKNMPSMYVASVRKVIPAYNFEGQLWKIQQIEMEKQKIQPANPAFNMAVFHDDGFVESDVDVEVQIAVVGEYLETDDIKFKQIAARTVASITYQGRYEKLPDFGETLANWIDENQYEFHGKRFHIYHVSPETEQKSENMVTEICFPITRKNTR